MAEFSGLPPHSSFEEENQDPQAIQPQQADNQPSAPTSGAIIPSPQPPLSSSSSGAARKPRGRPLGSKNKPRAPIYITQPAINFMQLHVPMGSDISDSVENYARRNRVGVRILNGSGNITHFRIRRPAMTTLTEGYTLVTMNGTYVDSTLYSNSVDGGISSFLPDGRPPWLTVYVNNNVGDVFGGILVSGVLAATNVVLHVQTFRSGEFQRLDFGQPDYGAPGGGGSDLGGGFGGGDSSGLGGGGLTIPGTGFGAVLTELWN